MIQTQNDFYSRFSSSFTERINVSIQLNEKRVKMRKDYLQFLLKDNFEKLCSDFSYDIIRGFFTDSNDSLKEEVDYQEKLFCFCPRYRQGFNIIKAIVEICDMFGVSWLEKKKATLMKAIHFFEDPMHIKYRRNFENSINEIRKCFDGVKDELNGKISLLEEAEIDRLNEAIHCFLEGCYYSAVAMSVSAIESRLLSLMTHSNPEAELEGLTLGQLIGEYLDNKEEYGTVIPKKHEPLLSHCNVYRIFSVHPKKEEINKPIASSILNMTFMFLLDKNLAEKVGVSKEKAQ